MFDRRYSEVDYQAPVFDRPLCVKAPTVVLRAIPVSRAANFNDRFRCIAEVGFGCIAAARPRAMNDG